MRWLVTGAHGQVGSEVGALLAGSDEPHGPATGDAVLLAGSADLDITDARSVDARIAEFRPDVVINTAAYTAVDDAETDEATAHLVNAAGPAHLATALARHGGRLIHLSTDYVFAGDADRPYETDAPTAPRSAYGRTKRDGERAVQALLGENGVVLRTAWVWGAVGTNFVKTMVRLERERDTVSVVADQVGSPTWARDLAIAVLELARSSAPGGIYHATNGGSTSWYGFAQAIFSELGADPERVEATTSADFVRPAPRPAYSVLADASWREAGFAPLPHWQDALHQGLAEILNAAV